MPPSKPSILLVDDEPDFLETFSYWLSSRGYKVSRAQSGSEALQMIARQLPDIVFLDIVMPDLDGLETLKRLRQSGVSVPVILLTTTGHNPTTLMDFQAYGITGVFQKQDTMEAFSQILEAALKAKS